MATAICKNCGMLYHWHARKGRKLTDASCPECGGPGRMNKAAEYDAKRRENKISGKWG